MSRKVRRVHYRLDAGDIDNLPQADIEKILRAADCLTMQGGRKKQKIAA